MGKIGWFWVDLLSIKSFRTSLTVVMRETFRWVLSALNVYSIYIDIFVVVRQRMKRWRGRVVMLHKLHSTYALLRAKALSTSDTVALAEASSFDWWCSANPCSTVGSIATDCRRFLEFTKAAVIETTPTSKIQRSLQEMSLTGVCMYWIVSSFPIGSWSHIRGIYGKVSSYPIGMQMK